MGQEDLTGSFTPEEQQEKKKPPKQIDANAPLFRLMGEIRDAIKENTEAINSLLTTLVGQTRDGPHMHLDVRQATPEEDKPVEQLEQSNIPLPESVPSETTSATPSTPIEKIRMMFPEDLENLLTFTEVEEDGGYIKVKPRQWLGSDNFAKVAAVIRGIGGEYKSAGKESHFRVPK